MKWLLGIATLIWAVWVGYGLATFREMNILAAYLGLTAGLILFPVLWGLYFGFTAASKAGRRAGLAVAVLVVLGVGGIYGHNQYEQWRFRNPGRGVDVSRAQLIPVGTPSVLAVPPAGGGYSLGKVVPDRPGIYAVEMVWQHGTGDAGEPHSATTLFMEGGERVGLDGPSDPDGVNLRAEVPVPEGKPFYLMFRPLTLSGQEDSRPNQVVVTVSYREFQKAP